MNTTALQTSIFKEQSRKARQLLLGQISPPSQTLQGRVASSNTENLLSLSHPLSSDWMEIAAFTTETTWSRVSIVAALPLGMPGACYGLMLLYTLWQV